MRRSQEPGISRGNRRYARISGHQEIPEISGGIRKHQEVPGDIRRYQQMSADVSRCQQQQITDTRISRI